MNVINAYAINAAPFGAAPQTVTTATAGSSEINKYAINAFVFGAGGSASTAVQGVKVIPELMNGSIPGMM
jgi:hypothetical protein